MELRAIPVETLWGPEAYTGPPELTTHDTYIRAVAALGIARVADIEARARLLNAKLVYGVGAGTGARGVCYGDAWRNGTAGHDLVEVCAFGQESTIQLAGTTLHEFGHVLAGWAAGHDKTWKAACSTLGLLTAQLYQDYKPEHFAPDVWSAIAALPQPNEGRPDAHAGAAGGMGRALPRLFKLGGGCPLGRGTKGGKSTGPGSGRLHLWVCQCDPPQKVRKAGELHAACTAGCEAPFTRAVKPANGKGEGE